MDDPTELRGPERKSRTIPTGRGLRRPAVLLLTLLAIEFLDEFVYGAREAAWPLIRDDLGLSYVQIGGLIPLGLGLVAERVDLRLTMWLLLLGPLALLVGLPRRGLAAQQ